MGIDVSNIWISYVILELIIIWSGFVLKVNSIAWTYCIKALWGSQNRLDASYTLGIRSMVWRPARVACHFKFGVSIYLDGLIINITMTSTWGGLFVQHVLQICRRGSLNYIIKSRYHVVIACPRMLSSHGLAGYFV
jgi:hypothetical protein